MTNSKFQIPNFICKHKHILLVMILATILRLVRAEIAPPALNWDEVSHGYNAYSILKTGNDEWGVFLPSIFRAYGDYKLPVYIYTTVISIWAFGLNVFAVRLPSILAGIVNVYFTFLIAKELFDEKKYKNVSLLASFLVAIEPWSLFLSRGAFEANLAQAFVIAAIYFFLKGVRDYEKHSHLLIYSAYFFGFSVWTYNSARVFVPLLVSFLIIIYRKTLIDIKRNKKIELIFALLIFYILVKPMFVQLVSSVGTARYEKVAILDQGAINEIVESRNSSEYSPIIARAIHNKATYFTKKFGENYFSHFSPRYLFIDGGDQYQFSVPGHGLLYSINLPFFYLGLAALLFSSFKSKKARSRFLIGWLLFAPIPSSITREAPHVLRSITMLPVPMIISAFGFSTLLDKVPKKQKIFISTTTIIYITAVLLLMFGYLRLYITNYRNDYSWSWQYGYEQLVKYSRDHYDEYDKIIVTKKYGEPHEFFLFYWPWHPESYRADPNLIRFKQSDWYWVDGFDKFYFINDWQIVEYGIQGAGDRDENKFILESGVEVDCSVGKCLLITSPGNVPDGWDKLEAIDFLDGKPAFEIYEN